MDVIEVFDTLTGAYLMRLPASSWSWKEQVNAPGSLSVTVPFTEDTRGMHLRVDTAPWRTILALVSAGRIIHAGPVFKRDWDAAKQVLTLDCGGFQDLLKRRLVLPAALRGFTSATLEGSENGLPKDWTLNLAGSLRNIMRALVLEAKKWGNLPCSVPPPDSSGWNQRSYLGADLATVATRIDDLANVLGGPEYRFTPRLIDGGQRINFLLEMGNPELVTGRHSWDQRRALTPVTDVKVSEDAAEIGTDIWAKAGGQADKILMARSHDTTLERAGWPLLQLADSTHSTVKELDTLKGYAQAGTQSASQSLEAISFKAARWDETGRAFADLVRVGDHLALQLEDEYLGSKRYRLKVLELSGDASEWITFACREVKA